MILVSGLVSMYNACIFRSQLNKKKKKQAKRLVNLAGNLSICIYIYIYIVLFFYIQYIHEYYTYMIIAYTYIYYLYIHSYINFVTPFVRNFKHSRVFKPGALPSPGQKHHRHLLSSTCFAAAAGRSKFCGERNLEIL